MKHHAKINLKSPVVAVTNTITIQDCMAPFMDRLYFNISLPTLCKEPHETPVIHRGTAVAIATIFIHSFLVNSRVHRVRAALDSSDWTKPGLYHTGRRGA